MQVDISVLEKVCEADKQAWIGNVHFSECHLRYV